MTVSYTHLVEYFLEVVDKLPELDGECVSQRIDLKVYKKDNLEYRRMNFMGMEESYGQYEEISQDQVKLYLKREFVHMINVDTVFVSLFAMEKRMLAKDAMVLHCSVPVSYTHLDVYKRQVTYSKARAKEMLCSESYMDNHQVLIVPANSKIKSLKDITKDTEVGIQSGSTAADAADLSLIHIL